MSRQRMAIAGVVAVLALAGSGVNAGSAVAKDAFCTKWESIAKGMGIVDFDNITKHIPEMAKVAKAFKDGESSAPAAIKKDFKTMSGVIQAMNTEVQKLKGLSETAAQAKLKKIEPEFEKMATKVGYEKAITNLGKWSAACK